jgi:hypothetical protein
MIDKVHSRRGIYRRNPYQASPANVETGSIMSNVHSAPISRLPPIKLSDIDQHQCSIDKHGVCNSAIHFILLDAVGYSKNSPGHHPKTAVCEDFDVKMLANPRIQFHSPVEIDYRVP